ncbi:unnamed protein product, partial [marine sediment metagenome]
LVLVASMMAFALPASASPDENEWSTFDYPEEGAPGDWFYDPAITAVGPMAQAINGDLFAYVESATTAAVKEVSTITFTGSPREGDEITVTVDGNGVAYTVVEADVGDTNAASLANIATGVAAAINHDVYASAVVTASASAAVVTLTADTAGLAGAFTVTCATAIGNLAVAVAETEAAADAGPAVAEVSTITFSGSPQVGDVITVTVNETEVITYPVVSGDISGDNATTLANIAAKVAAALNADADAKGIVD